MSGPPLAHDCTSAGVTDDLPVPRARAGFHTQLFEHYQPRMPEVDGLSRTMFVAEVSRQTVARWRSNSVARQLRLDRLAGLP
jgi:hypothetical protein